MPGGNNLISPVKIFEKLGLGSGMRVGDFGCGRLGVFALTAAKIVGDKGMVYAVDVVKTILAALEERAKTERIDNIKTVWSNLEVYGATKVENESLDAGFIINVLFQTDKDAAIIRECSRMVKPGGKLMIIDWKKEGALFGPALKDRIDREEVARTAGGLGLKQVDSFEAGPCHFGMIFEK